MTDDTDWLAAFDPALYDAGDDVDDRHAVDWSGIAPCRPQVVLKPRTTDDVAAMLRRCHRAAQPVVVQGGRTGLSGGATPQAGEWALSLERLTTIHGVDRDGMTMTVGAGVPLQRVQDTAADHGLRFPVDLGARGSCLAGGIVATNAGGNGVIRYGMTRALVLGLVAVLADGTVVPARNTLLKNNSGFDLKQLFIGTEGTLGVVTEITFRLVPARPDRQTALLALPNYAAVCALLRRLTGALDGLSAFELMWPGYYRAACRSTDVADPFEGAHGYYVLIEAEGSDPVADAERVQSVLATAMDEGEVSDAALAQSGNEAAAFWSIRDGIAEMMPGMQPLFSFDIGIPVADIDAFRVAAEARLTARFPDIEAHFFGHVGDGNVHIVGTTGRDGDAPAIDEIVYGEARRFGGAVSAEHGIGTLKRDWLSMSRSDAEIELMRTLKRSLDPAGILNPNRVI